jgi:hypothetical protein
VNFFSLSCGGCANNFRSGQVEDLGIGDHQSIQELANYSELCSNRHIQNLKCKEEVLADTNSRDSDDVSQFFRSDDNACVQTKRRKYSMVRREISYEESADKFDDKERMEEYCIETHQSYNDSLNAGKCDHIQHL